MNQLSDDVNADAGHSFSFFVVNDFQDENTDSSRLLLVDTGATAHVVTDSQNFCYVDKTFKPEDHYVELADGTKSNNVVLLKGDALVMLRDSNGELIETLLEDALCIPSYPQDIFSVQAATKKGAHVSFSKDSAELVCRDGLRFDIQKKGRLYYLQQYYNHSLNVIGASVVKRSLDLSEWHVIMGHCNYDDLLKLENVVEGMSIKNRNKLQCEGCIMGKEVKWFSRKPDERSKFPMEFIHADLSGAIEPTAVGGFNYAFSIVDDYSSAIFMYFLKKKSDATKAFEKFLADTAPYGQVKRLRSDNGGEFISSEFKDVLIKNKISFESSAPYSPHQNGTVERGWRTIFDMARCMLIDSKLQRSLWTYAVMAAVYIRNRCYHQRLQTTPVFMLTGKAPDVSKLHVFGSVCYYYVEKKKKLDQRYQKGYFVGYDRDSPAYLVYDAGSVKRVRCVKFTEKFDVVGDTKVISSGPTVSHKKSVPVVNNSNHFVVDDEEEELFLRRDPVQPVVPVIPVVQPDMPVEYDIGLGIENTGDDIDVAAENIGDGIDVTAENISDVNGRRYPDRSNRSLPAHLDDYVVGDANVETIEESSIVDDEEDNVDRILFVDCCYKASNIVVPKTYREAVNSEHAPSWKKAMDEEIQSLKDNDTYNLVNLPANKNCIGGRWVYSIKGGPKGVDIFKARYVAKGFKQRYGSDYFDTFAPTAKVTTIRLFVQLAVQYNLVIHQMDVKTAYLNAPIDVEVFVQQPEGYNEESPNAVCRLNKSLYGLKQSGRCWNQLLHNFLVKKGFIQSNCDPCLYKRLSDLVMVLLLVWVDDILIAARSSYDLNATKDILKKEYKMKDLGEVDWFLGMKFVQNQGVITISQEDYIRSKITKFGMIDAKPRSTPCESGGYKVVEDAGDSSQYREMVGSLVYAMTCTRPDLSWVVTKLSQHLENPSCVDLVMLKHVFRYLIGTVHYKLTFRKVDNIKLIGYTDADWGNYPDRKSISGYYFTMSDNGPAISWKSKKQATVALSSCEAEYMALSLAIQEAIYLSMLIKDLLLLDVHPVKLYVDNQGAISLAKNPVNHARSKHIDIRYNFVRDHVTKKKIEIEYVSTEHNVADLMTKPFSKQKIRIFKDLLFGIGR